MAEKQKHDQLQQKSQKCKLEKQLRYIFFTHKLDKKLHLLVVNVGKREKCVLCVSLPKCKLVSVEVNLMISIENVKLPASFAESPSFRSLI